MDRAAERVEEGMEERVVGKGKKREGWGESERGRERETGNHRYVLEGRWAGILDSRTGCAAWVRERVRERDRERERGGGER